MNQQKCEHCPLRDEALACPTHTYGHPFCDHFIPGSPTFHPKRAESLRMIATGQRADGGEPMPPRKPLTLDEAVAEWYWNAVSLARRCCNSADRRRFDAYADLSAEERRLWPF